jgi:hypothetical protein
MIKIAIIELASHFEVARAYAKMALANGYSVLMVVNESNHSQLKSLFDVADKIEWMVGPDDVMGNFLSTCKSAIDQCNLVICCTPEQKNGTVILKEWLAISYLVVHDVNNYFDIVKNINTSGGIRQYLRIAKFYFTGYFSKRQKALQTFDGVIVPSIHMKSYADAKTAVKQIITLPFLYNEHLPVIHNHDTTNIVIPGTVNQRSRNYDFVHEVMCRMDADGFDCPVSLTLLGQCKGQKAQVIRQKFLSMNFQWLQVTTFEEAVSQSTYDKLMLEADFYLLPLQRRWQYGIVNEIGGTTCLSGNIGDMVRYGMPILLPIEYQLQDLLLPLVTHYDNEVSHAAKVWSDFIKNKTYNQVKQTAVAPINAMNAWLAKQMSILAKQ